MKRGRWAKAKTLPEDSARGTGLNSALAQRRGPCFPALGSAGTASSLPSGIPRGHPARRCTPWPYLVVIWERRRKSQPRTVAGTTHSSHLSTSHSNPGKMARRRGCARGACVNRAEAGGGAKSARAPPKFEGPISGLNDPAVFALRSQATVPFPLTVLAGVTIPIFLRLLDCGLFLMSNTLVSLI